MKTKMTKADLIEYIATVETERDHSNIKRREAEVALKDCESEKQKMREQVRMVRNATAAYLDLHPYIHSATGDAMDQSEAFKMLSHISRLADLPHDHLFHTPGKR